MRNLVVNRVVLAIILAFVVCVTLTITAPEIGLTWDEPAYIAASESYMGWFSQLFTHPSQAITPYSISQAWQINHEHPPLDKIWSGIVWVITRPVLDDLTAHRLGNIILVSILVALLFLFVADTYGLVAGFASVTALMTMPRFFFHAHLAALDMPAAVSIFAVTCLFWWTVDRKEWWWGILWGLAWGLALATKINAIFLPVTLGLWVLIFRRRWNVVLRMALMGIIAIPVFIASWPWLYHQTWERLWEYIGFVTTKHWQIGQWYLGSFYLPPPWHFPFVMLFAVVPLTITVLCIIGIFRAGTGKQDKGLVWLLILSALTPLLALSIGQSVVYDNERLFMPAFPFLAALTGIAFGWIIQEVLRYSSRWKQVIVRPILVTTLIAIVFVPQVITMVGLYPHLLSYYSESIGGVPGAARLGLETTYWCESYNQVLDAINGNASPGDVIWADPWSHDVLMYYQLHGRLRNDVRVWTVMETGSILGPDSSSFVTSPDKSANWFIFQYRQTMYGEGGEEKSILPWLKTLKLVERYAYQGIPIVDLYKR
jgi:4-amino-4-deoxy-L-arabinose transferase-like glycosyltransferase